MTEDFCYAGERFADIQMLRYRLNGFSQLTLKQKLYVYYLSEATLWGRDITFDQMGADNLQIRKLMEVVCLFARQQGLDQEPDYQAMMVYLKRLWFSNGIHHHYGGEKFRPDFSEEYWEKIIRMMNSDSLPLKEGQTVDEMVSHLKQVIFDPIILSKRVNKTEGEDLVVTSACNFYQNVTQDEVEAFYGQLKVDGEAQPPSWGLNSRLVKEDGELKEYVWKENGLYGEAISKIVYWLRKAAEVAENEEQRDHSAVEPCEQ